MAELAKIGSLWIDGPLSWMEQASISSFLELGHDYVLYTYGKVDNVPEGAKVEDARSIWPNDNIIIHTKAQSPAIHADIFRVIMMKQTGRVWADTDIIALRPFHASLEWFFGHERTDRELLGNAIMGFPDHSKTLEALFDFLTDDYPIPPWFNAKGRRILSQNRDNGVPINLGDYPWGTTGPVALTHFARECGEFHLAQPQSTFFPVSFQHRKTLVHPSLYETLVELMERENSLCVHLYSRWLRKYTGGDLPAQNSWLGKYLQQHNLANYPTSDVKAVEKKKPAHNPDEPKNRIVNEDPEAFFTDLTIRKSKAPDLVNTSPHGRVVLLTMAKDEGPYVLEWIAYHHLMGFTDILVYTNDCTDGTDEMFDALAELGLLTRADNPELRQLPPQSRGLKRAQAHPLIKSADWVLLTDLDEFLTVNVGTRTVNDLIDVTQEKDATAMALAWRFFGDSGQQYYEDRLVTERLTRAASDGFAKGYGVKTLFKQMDHLRLAIHRPRIIHKREKSQPFSLNWVNGSGKPVDGKIMTWRMTRQSVGYELGQINHYGVKSKDEYLMRRLRGDVLNNHSKYDADYFKCFNRNEIEDVSAAQKSAEVKALMAKLLKNPAVAAAAETVQNRYKEKLERLHANDAYAEQIAELQDTQKRK